ncbi:MAG: 3-hydroxyacyl-CoA dehydrogenase family protein, partial [Pseudomonadota bacterium]
LPDGTLDDIVLAIEAAAGRLRAGEESIPFDALSLEARYDAERDQVALERLYIDSAKAEATLRTIGMAPLRVRAEIDAHIADRFLEAVWREALWLVKDGIATTEEIDDAIRYGFGLRWAQMGLFETYRIAGGEDGMTHFLQQFGPCLKWPWTKLMDVPDLDAALVDKIARQSEAQSGHHGIRDLERIRDDNLVAILRAL